VGLLAPSSIGWRTLWRVSRRSKDRGEGYRRPRGRSGLRGRNLVASHDFVV